MPSSHKFWKERYFFVSGRYWEYNPSDQEDTLGVLTSWTTPGNLREFSLAPIGSNFRKSLGVSNSGLVVWFSGVWPSLSLEDEEVKRRLVRYHPRAYSELIRSDIPWSSGAKPARLPVLRSSRPSVMKPSSTPCLKVFFIFCPRASYHEAYSGRALSRLKVLAKKKRSVKQKTQASPEGFPPAHGKILKVGVSSSPLSTIEAGDSSGRAVEPPWRFFLFQSGVLCCRAPSPLL